MIAKKITVKQNGHHLPVMGKGKYAPTQSNNKNPPKNSPLPDFVNQEDTLQMATNYL